MSDDQICHKDKEVLTKLGQIKEADCKVLVVLTISSLAKKTKIPFSKPRFFA
jgi:hypothetical protein